MRIRTSKGVASRLIFIEFCHAVVQFHSSRHPATISFWSNVCLYALEKYIIKIANAITVMNVFWLSFDFDVDQFVHAASPVASQSTN